LPACPRERLPPPVFEKLLSAAMPNLERLRESIVIRGVPGHEEYVPAWIAAGVSRFIDDVDAAVRLVSAPARSPLGG
ncbi:MAG: hypothetical protein QME96_17960, partial [Myxococcota bacterium]|nr:hypothetical protein [Myxococcota bacterium]